MSTPRPRMYLSPPSMSEFEVEAAVTAIRSGWVAPLGPEVDGFEAEICAFTSVPHAVALASGTAAIHLGLKALGVEPGQDVLVPTLTFGATAFAVTYAGAHPVFLDVEETSWNLDPQVLRETLVERARKNALPAVILPVDLFGRTCDYASIVALAHEFEVPILEDAAEALGASHGSTSAGSFGRAAVFSFNGNKIMTTGGGGMFVTDDKSLADKVRFWSTQSREPLPWYQHEEIGYNYRLSSVLAAIGRAQLRRLPAMITRRREILAQYSLNLGIHDGVSLIQDPPWGRGNSWLTNVRFDLVRHPDAPELVRLALESENIESRPVWKPMHQQPVFKGAECHLTGAADRIFADGLCLPSGADMTDADIDLVSQIVVATLR